MIPMTMRNANNAQTEEHELSRNRTLRECGEVHLCGKLSFEIRILELWANFNVRVHQHWIWASLEPFNGFIQ